MALTDKQRVFIDEYLVDFNATRAAIAAGYSEKTARFIGSENLTKPNIREEIDRLITEHCMGKDEVLMRLANHARGDIDDYLNEQGQFDLAKARAARKTGLIKKLKTKTTARVIMDAETTTTEVEFELYDAQSALLNLGKHLDLFSDKLQIKLEKELKQALEVLEKSLDSNTYAHVLTVLAGKLGSKEAVGD